MGKVINLRTIRKQKTREQSRSDADNATTVTSINKIERTRVKHLNDLSERGLDGHKRDEDS